MSDVLWYAALRELMELDDEIENMKPKVRRAQQKAEDAQSDANRASGQLYRLTERRAASEAIVMSITARDDIPAEAITAARQAIAAEINKRG